jgi:hypothetical protein
MLKETIASTPGFPDVDTSLYEVRVHESSNLLAGLPLFTSKQAAAKVAHSINVYGAGTKVHAYLVEHYLDDEGVWRLRNLI